MRNPTRFQLKSITYKTVNVVLTESTMHYEDVSIPEPHSFEFSILAYRKVVLAPKFIILGYGR